MAEDPRKSAPRCDCDLGMVCTLPYVLRFLWETRLWVRFGPLHPEKFHPNPLIVKISLGYSTSEQREREKETRKQTPH